MLACVLIVILDGGVPEAILVGAAAFGAVTAAKAAVSIHVPLADAVPPAHPVLFFNPKSGGGKAQRFKLADEARARGIEPIELTRGADLEQLVRDAVADGADAVAMAGGDGSQAVVAMVAAELDLPYACIPSGTRNHFALDLGVDRDDVVGALDSFVDGGERRVDLAEVNGRVFVNNVSLGLYAEAVQKDEYREAKLRTILDTLPDALGPEGEGIDLQWTGPGGSEHSSGAAILVSNNRYRLGRAVGSGTRPRIDDGLLGVTVAAAPIGRGGQRRLPQRPWREWSTLEFEVDADGPIAAGIDGESWSWNRRCASGSGPVCCGSGSPEPIPAPRRPPRYRRTLGAAFGRWRGRRPADPRGAGAAPGKGVTPHGNGTTPGKGEPMDIVEVEQKETVSRKEVATRLRRLATQLTKGNEVKFEQGGITMKVHVPDEVQLKVEVEAATDERELEIELTW